MKNISIQLPKLYRGFFKKRPNRFLAEVELLNDKRVHAFVADPGRLQELLLPDAEVYLSHSPKKGRTTDYDLRLVKNDNYLVSVDSRVPNKMVNKALLHGALEPFAGYEVVKREPRIKGGRLDFFLNKDNSSPCFLEVKSCTLVEGETALFPDAPTSRGARHLTELAELKREGNRTAVIFIIQHPRATFFTPNKKMDPVFTEAFVKAVEAGVEVYAYKCRVTLRSIMLEKTVEVIRA